MRFAEHTLTDIDPEVRDPFVCAELETDGLAAEMRRVGESLAKRKRMEAIPGRRFGVRQLAKRMRWLRRVLDRIERHNDRVRFKWRMLGDSEWRERVLRELGGERALLRWEKAWRRLLSGEGAERGGRERVAHPCDAARTPTARRDGRCEFRLARHTRGLWREKTWSRGEAEIAAKPRETVRKALRDAMFPVPVYPSELRGEVGAGDMPLEAVELQRVGKGLEDAIAENHRTTKTIGTENPAVMEATGTESAGGNKSEPQAGLAIRNWAREVVPFDAKPALEAFLAGRPRDASPDAKPP